MRSSGSMRSNGSMRSSSSILGRSSADGRVAVLKDTRVLTREGYFPLAELPQKELEFWTGSHWEPGTVSAVTRSAPFFRVRLTDGTHLDCSEEHTWPVLLPSEDRICTRTTLQLQTDDYIAPSLSVAGEAGEASEASEDSGRKDAPGAYDLGQEVGKKLVDGYRLGAGLPRPVYTMSAQALGEFVAGWMDSQDGVLSGCDTAVADLKVLLLRLGVSAAFIARNLHDQVRLEIAASEAAKIPNPRRADRKHFREFERPLQQVESIEDLRKKHKAYTLTLKSGHTVLLGGVLART